jgi:DNA replication ATP-dependent helicase Dna2
MSFATTREPALESQRRDFLSNPQRLNVALTRAQRKLILVGNVSALEHLPTFSRLITYCHSMNTLLATPEFAPQPVDAQGIVD